MKSLYALLRSFGTATLLLLAVPIAQAQTGIGTTSPNASAALDITSANRGLLIPRVALGSVNDGATILLPETALLVYNTSSAMAGPGFYFNAGPPNSPNWQRFVSSSASVGLEFWGIKGNTGTDPANNFLGTTDLKDLVFKVNSIERFRMRPDATALLTSDLEVSGKSTLAGSVKVTGANSTTTLRNTFVGLPSDKALLTVNGDIITYAASGNGGGLGSLTVAGPTALSSTLGVVGLTTLSSAKITGLVGTGSRAVVTAADGTLSATAILGSNGEFIANSGTSVIPAFNVVGSGRVGTTLTVVGFTTLAGLTAGSSTLSSATVTNALSAGSLGVSGATTLSSTLAVVGAPTFTILGGLGTRLVVTDNVGNLTTQVIPTPINAILNQNSVDQSANFRINGSSQVGSINVSSNASVLGNGTVLGTFGVSGASTLNSLGVTNNASIGGILTVTGTTALNGSSTLNSATVTNALSAGTLSTSGLATLASAKVTGLLGTGSRVVVAAADGSLSATSALPGSGGEFIANLGTSTTPAFNIAGSGQVGTTLAVGGATTLAGLTAGSSTLSSATVTNALSAGSLVVSGATTLAGLSAGTTTLGGLTAGTTTLSSAKVSSLSGANTRMVVADILGNLATQAILPPIDAILNQNSEPPQPANFNISGSGRVMASMAVGTALTVGTTLGVTGASTLGSLTAGATTLNSATVTTALGANTLAVSGAAAFSNTLTVAGAATMNANLAVNGTSALTGNVGIGTTVGSERLTVAGNVVPSMDAAPSVGYDLGAPNMRWSNVYASKVFTSNGIVQTSDARLKTNITGLGYGMSTVMALRPVRYAWKKTPNQTNKIGFLAQEVQQVVPEVVSVGSDANQTLGVSYAELVPVLVKALQEQQAQLDSMRGRAEKAEAAVQSFESRLRALEAGSPVNATAQGQR